jgi:hypothetical protein
MTEVPSSATVGISLPLARMMLTIQLVQNSYARPAQPDYCIAFDWVLFQRTVATTLCTELSICFLCIRIVRVPQPYEFRCLSCFPRVSERLFYTCLKSHSHLIRFLIPIFSFYIAWRCLVSRVSGYFASIAVMADPTEKTDPSPHDSRDLMNSSLTDVSKKSEDKEAEQIKEKDAGLDVEAQNVVPEPYQRNAQEDYYHMPTWRFVLVVIVTCLTVLCMALVNIRSSELRKAQVKCANRTIASFPPRYRKLQILSTP